MPGTFTPTVFGDGQLPATVGTLYEVPVSSAAYIKCLNLFNTNAAQQTILVYTNTSGTRRVLARYVLNQNERAFFDDTVILTAGDKIEAVTTTGTAVDWFMSGVLET